MATVSKLLVGKIAIETGRVVILDPEHLEPLQILIDARERLLEVEPAQAKTISFANGVEFAVVSNTRCGDGSFPVYLETRNGFPLRLVIDFETPAGRPADWFPADRQEKQPREET